MDIQRPDLAVKKKRRRLIAGSVAVAVLALGTLGLARLEPAALKVDKNSVWLDTVKQGELLREVRGPGVLQPKEIRWIAAESNARVEHVLVKPGATVKADTIILELSNPDVIDARLAAEAQLAAANADFTAKRIALESAVLDLRANLATVRADAEGARLRAEAEADLSRKGVISGLQYKESELKASQLKERLGIEQDRLAKAEENMKAQLVAERSRLDQQENTVKLRRTRADALNVRAGIDGVLQQVPVEEGQQVAAGANLARVAKPDVLIAKLQVPETQARDVRIDQKVRIDPRSGNNTTVAAHVVRIDPAVKNGSVEVDVDFDAALPEGARPDQSVDGVVEIERLANVVYVGRPASGQAGASVSLFRLDGDSHIARRVPVKLGRASVSLIEVVEGLKVGDRVVLSDTTQWEQQDRIRIE